MKCSSLFLALFLFLLATDLSAHKRDYLDSYVEDDNPYLIPRSTPSNPHPDQLILTYLRCLGCTLEFLANPQSNYYRGIEKKLLYLIPANGPACHMVKCPYKWNTYFNAYLSVKYNRYISLFKHHLDYCNLHRECLCYWPEHSALAAEINDDAYDLFKDLLSTTALSDLVISENTKFLQSGFYCTTYRSTTLSIIIHQFRFSHYYYTYLDLLNWSYLRYSAAECAKIKGKLEDILEVLYPKFLSLYSSCLNNHPNPEIEKELKFMKLLVRDISGFDEATIGSFVLPDNNSEPSISEKTNTEKSSKKGKNEKRSKRKKKIIDDEPVLLVKAKQKNINGTSPVNAFSIDPEFSLEEGAFLNDLLLYKDAITVISDSISKEPQRNAYAERACAFFEIGELRLALKDYAKAQKLTVTRLIPKGGAYGDFFRLPEKGLNFARGLVSGALEGTKESVSDFVPSVVNSCTGLAHGLWCFVCSPKEVSEEFLNAAYEMGLYLTTLNSNELLEIAVPELRELSFRWLTLDDYERGKKIGYIIGKYGVDIFGPGMTVRGVQKVQALKRANTLLTVEMCAASQAKQITILEESAKYAGVREKLVQATKKGKIVVKSANVQPHIMQPKHSWGKLIVLSGNQEQDFRKVITLLEEHNIADKKFIYHDPIPIPDKSPKIIRTDYEKEIGGETVHAVFETYTETGEMYLKNAWVVQRE